MVAGQIDIMGEARDWLEDCFEDLPDDLTDDEVRRAVDRHYAGGWGAFILATDV
jgi:hypothetical protein